MTAAWIVAGLAVAAIVGVGVWDALRRPGDDRDLEQPHHVERMRPRAEANAGAAVGDADEEAAAPLVAFMEEVSTGGFPALAFAADPLSAPIPDWHEVETERFFNALAADRLSAFTWNSAPAAVVPLTSVPVPHVPEVDAFALEGPTGQFSKDWIARAMAAAEAKAGADR